MRPVLLVALLLAAAPFALMPAAALPSPCPPPDESGGYPCDPMPYDPLCPNGQDLCRLSKLSEERTVCVQGACLVYVCTRAACPGAALLCVGIREQVPVCTSQL